MNSSSCVLVETFRLNRCATVKVAEIGIATEVYTSISQLSNHVWDKIVEPHNNLFLSHAYLQALENAHRERMSFRYVVFSERGKKLGAAYFQLFDVRGNEALKSSAQTDLETDPTGSNPVLTRIKRAVKKISYRQIAKLRLRMLVCGNALLTGEHGLFFNKKVSKLQANQLLHRAISQIEADEKAEGRKISLTLIKDFDESKADEARNLLNYGFKEINFQPNMVFPLQTEWQTFDNYLQAMHSKYRVRTKKVLSKRSGLVVKDFTYSDIEQHLPEIYRYYSEVADSVDFNLLSASPQYFLELKQQLSECFKLIGYFKDQTLVGFICAFVGKGHLEVHFTGYNQELNKEHAIYSNMLYEMVNMGLQNRVKTIGFGRTALEIKSTIGAVGTNMPAFIKHSNSLVHRYLIPLINQFNQAHWIPRHPFKHHENEGEGL